MKSTESMEFKLEPALPEVIEINMDSVYSIEAAHTYHGVHPDDLEGFFGDIETSNKIDEARRRIRNKQLSAAKRLS